MVVNIPGTYPAQPNDGGILVSGFVSPTLERSVQPPSLVPFLQERDYLIDVDLGLGHKDLDAFCEQLFAHHAARTRVLVDLLDDGAVRPLLRRLHGHRPPAPLPVGADGARRGAVGVAVP